MHLFKMLHIQISLGQTASVSEVQQQSEQALVRCITMPAQCPPLLTPNLQPHMRIPTHPTALSKPASFSLQKQPPRLPGSCLPIEPMGFSSRLPS